MPLDESQGMRYAPDMNAMSDATPPQPPWALESSLRLAAIDLDGTLLGADHTVGDANRRAVARLIAAGYEVVLASGRHYLSMRPHAEQLPGVRWLVAAQGGEVSDIARSTVLERHLLTPSQLALVTGILHRRGVGALYYAPEGILTDSPASESLEFYVTLSGNTLQRVTTVELATRSVFKVVSAGTPAVIDELIASAEVQAIDVQRVRSHQRFFEFMPWGVTKATGLQALTKHLGLSAKNVVAFGDADNDVPMFQWAGLSYAMPHGWPSAKAHATRVAPEGGPDDAFARAVEELLGP